MIVGFRHKGLEKLFFTGNPKGIRPEHKNRLQNILLILNNADCISDLSTSPGLGLHPLKGKLEGHWAVRVSRSWRLTFIFNEENIEVSELDYLDYH